MAGQFFGRALRVAAGDDNFGLGIQAMRAADEGAGRAVGLGGHAAGVHDDHVGCERLALGKRAQLRSDRLAIGARGPAAEVFDVKTGHHCSV